MTFLDKDNEKYFIFENLAFSMIFFRNNILFQIKTSLKQNICSMKNQLKLVVIPSLEIFSSSENNIKTILIDAYSLK